MAAEPGISALIRYLENLAAAVSRAADAGQPVAELYDELPMWGIQPPADVPAEFHTLLHSLHRLNILLAYRWWTGTRASAAATGRRGHG